MKKVLYVFGGSESDVPEQGGKRLAELFRSGGEFELDTTNDLDAFSSLPGGRYAGVVVFTGGLENGLTPEREKALLGFVKGGGGFVGIHSAAGSFGASQAYREMLNVKLKGSSDESDFSVAMAQTDHYITVRFPDFTVCEKMLHLGIIDRAKCVILASAHWQGKQVPMAYVREHEKGRVVYLAAGHAMETWHNPEFLKLLTRAVAWSTGSDLSGKIIACGLLGYGPSFGMGKGHGCWVNGTFGMTTVAMCDADPARTEAAKQEMPGLKGYFTSLDDMLAVPGLDLVVNILPHNLHAPTALKCLEAGKHVVLEKPFCIAVEEANAMIAKAREKKVMLSLFHNRRWDGDYLTIRDLVARGLIGDIFHVECCLANYGHPGTWWRSDKAISGGVMHDWGAHFIDWILNLVPSKVTQVTGDFQKRVWHSVTNEDHGEAYIRFENGVTADYWISSMAALSRPRWLILGTLGAIKMDVSPDQIEIVSHASGVRVDGKVKVTRPGYGTVQYYRNVADHLLMGEGLSVTPEQARRVIAVIEAAQRSSELGKSVAPAEGCE